MNTNQLTQFRDEVYQNFNNGKRTDTLMDLVDALSSNTHARTVVELSLSPHFRRLYSALNKAIAASSLNNQQLARLASQSLDELRPRKFYLLGTDVTSNPGPHAHTLPDRGFVYHPNPIWGNKPIPFDISIPCVGSSPRRSAAIGWSPYRCNGCQAGKTRNWRAPTSWTIC